MSVHEVDKENNIFMFLSWDVITNKARIRLEIIKIVINLHIQSINDY